MVDNAPIVARIVIDDSAVSGLGSGGAGGSSGVVTGRNGSKESNKQLREVNRLLGYLVAENLGIGGSLKRLVIMTGGLVAEMVKGAAGAAVLAAASRAGPYGIAGAGAMIALEDIFDIDFAGVSAGADEGNRQTMMGAVFNKIYELGLISEERLEELAETYGFIAITTASYSESVADTSKKQKVIEQKVNETATTAGDSSTEQTNILNQQKRLKRAYQTLAEAIEEEARKRGAQIPTYFGEFYEGDGNLSSPFTNFIANNEAPNIQDFVSDRLGFTEINIASSDGVKK